jgi:hypothetical protein
MYYCLFHSHLIYAIQIWSCTSHSNIKKLFVKQKMGLRVINNARYNAHSEPLFKSSTILPLPKLIEYFNLLFMFKYVNFSLPASFASIWIQNEERRDHENFPRLRNTSEFYTPANRLVTTDLFPLTNFSKIWNALPPEVSQLQVSYIGFKTLLKNKFLDGLSANPNCNRLLCPSCHLHFI